MSLRRVALVTGSTSGIGLQIARRLAGAGYDVMMNGFGEPQFVESLVNEMSRNTGQRILFSGADVTEPDAVDQMVQATLAEFGRLDVLVNNAGIQFVSPIVEFPVEKWKAVLDINLSAAFYTTRAALPTMFRQSYGRIINVASAHGLVASPLKSAYVAAKHGLIGLTKVTALEGAPYQVTCNAICPGFVDTPLVEKQISSEMSATGRGRETVIAEVILAKHAIKQFVGTDQIAAFVEFLCTPSAASITGAALPIDAGWTAS